MADDAQVERWRRELAAPLSHSDADQLHAQADEVLAWVLDEFETLPDRPIGSTASRSELEPRLGGPPPEEGETFDEVFRAFREDVAPFAFRTHHPRFLAFVPAGPTLLSVLGDILCTGTNFFSGVWLEAAGPAQVEVTVLDWFREFLGMPPGTRGVLTSGGSEANLTALVVARDRLPFEDRRRSVLYVSEARHRSVDRAGRIIGLHPDQVQPVAADAAFRLDPDALLEAINRDRAAGRRPWSVAANAGSTDTGAVDPLASLADVCSDHGLWLHVDAAYGWPAVLVPEGKAALAGIERADSVTLDPHKWFAQTFAAGCVLVREGRQLADSFTVRPDYLQDVTPTDGEINFADHGLALTRRFRALKIRFSVKALGVGWYRRLVERCLRLADLAQALIERTPGLEVMHPRQLSIVCFRYNPAPTGTIPNEELDRLNRELVVKLRESRSAFLSSTRLHGRVALRLCFVNWRTTAGDVEEIIRVLSKLARGLG